MRSGLLLLLSAVFIGELEVDCFSQPCVFATIGVRSAATSFVGLRRICSC